MVGGMSSSAANKLSKVSFYLFPFLSYHQVDFCRALFSFSSLLAACSLSYFPFRLYLRHIKFPFARQYRTKRMQECVHHRASFIYLYTYTHTHTHLVQQRNRFCLRRSIAVSSLLPLSYLNLLLSR